jgi:hypothetical protein
MPAIITAVVRFAGEHSAAVLACVFVLSFAVSGFMWLAWLGYTQHPDFALPGQAGHWRKRLSCIWAPPPDWKQVRRWWWFWLVIGSSVASLAWWIVPYAAHPTLTTPTTIQLSPPREKLGLFKGLEIIAQLSATPPSIRGQVIPSARGIKWAMLLTYSPENRWLADLFSQLIGRAAFSINSLARPNQEFSLDAPVIPKRDISGIILHGNNLFNELVFSVFRQCFIVRTTNDSVDDIYSWYKKLMHNDEQFVWIEIGPGSPWRGDANCSL